MWRTSSHQASSGEREKYTDMSRERAKNGGREKNTVEKKNLDLRKTLVNVK